MAIIQIEERRYADVRPSIQGIDAIFGRRAFAWGAVWAGVIGTTALQLLCGLAVDPNAYLLGGQVPVTGISPLAGVWYVLYMGIAMFVGGSIAGRTGGDTRNRYLHGFIAWALSSVLGFYALAVWGGQLNIGPATPLLPETGDVGLGMISQGWMLGGLIVGLVASLLGADRAAEQDMMLP